MDRVNPRTTWSLGDLLLSHHGVEQVQPARYALVEVSKVVILLGQRQMSYRHLRREPQSRTVSDLDGEGAVSNSVPDLWRGSAIEPALPIALSSALIHRVRSSFEAAARFMGCDLRSWDRHV